ncbi:MAG: M20/M25/M40 family metallo-hydrolase [Acidobacteriota bacterium]|nr:M20/M25/M40 family metallo-hydrolase [Acidobacteriota bacterium]
MNRSPQKHVLVTLPLILALSFGLAAQEKLDLRMLQRIRQEGLDHSKVMDTLSWLSDVHGPRLSNSPQYHKAAEWVIAALTELGLVDAKTEPWGTFGRGWEMQKVYAAMTSPQYMPMIAYPKAWTPGTEGVIKGAPILVDIKTAKDLEKFKGQVRGAIVLTRGEQPLTISFDPHADRHTEEELAKLSLAPEPRALSPSMPTLQEITARQQLQTAIAKFFKDEGAAVLLEPGKGRDGTVFVAGGGSHMKGAALTSPQLVVAPEHYNRIVRIIRKNVPVELEIEVQARFFDDDLTGRNIIAEIPGVDKKLKNEIVMLGGHFDTWHTGTGATDNGAGCAVAMEAVRILKALGVQPRRTIRVALWDAEEQGLFGSREYVKAHFYDRAKKEKKPEYDRLSVYFNYDNGGGRIRGIYAQNNLEAAVIFEDWLKPLRDLGATTVALRNTGGTDHLSFEAVGLPGFQFIQDEIEYDTRTHHANMDVYDHVNRADLIQAATVMAAFVYNAAMRDEKMPRKHFDPNARPQGLF